MYKLTDVTDDYLKAVKRHLNITWDDEDTDAEVKELICDASATLDKKLGKETDYLAEPSHERTLFKALCFYKWNRAESSFDENYQNDILQVRALNAASEEVSDEESV